MHADLSARAQQSAQHVGLCSAIQKMMLDIEDEALRLTESGRPAATPVHADQADGIGQVSRADFLCDVMSECCQ